jgi:hypothetical protein
MSILAGDPTVAEAARRSRVIEQLVGRELDPSRGGLEGRSPKA